jgi:pimeloyl-ACP methyl ester carboxylesterase
MRTLLKIIVGVLIALLLLCGAAVALTWAPDRSVAELSQRWAPPPSQFVEIAGMNVHLRDEGPRDDATPLLLLHGTSASLHTWDGWTEQLKTTHRVIRVDLPGFGLTGPTPDGDYRMARYVEFVIALLDHLGIERAVLAGNSFGGHIAWETALAHPARVDSLILVDAAGYPLQSTSVPIGFRIARMPVLNRLMQVTLPRSFIESSVRNVYGDPERVTPELVDRYYELTLRAGNRAALAGRFAQAQPDGTAARIPELKLPTLILWGGRDGLIPLENGERFHREIAGSGLVVFETLGHVPHEEDPEATATAVQRFLTQPEVVLPPDAEGSPL